MGPIEPEPCEPRKWQLSYMLQAALARKNFNWGWNELGNELKKFLVSAKEENHR